MNVDELIDEIAMFIELGFMLGEEAHTIAESLYKKYIAKEDKDEVLQTDDE